MTGNQAAVRPAGQRLTQLVNVRVSPGEAARWSAAAAAAGLSRSDWVRLRVAGPDEVTGRPAPRRRGLPRGHTVRADPALIAQLARIGNNLNQLARWANTEHRHVVDLATLRLIHTEVTRLRELASVSDPEGGQPR